MPENCQHQLLARQCQLCQKDFSQPIISLATKDIYWGVSERALIQDFLQRAQEVGFSVALAEPAYQVFSKYAKFDKRADFHFLLPLKPEAKVLDVGSGYGNITIPLASWVNSVWAIDATRELLEFSYLKSQAANLKNITYVHSDPFGDRHLPLADQQFEAAIVNGVLEWVGGQYSGKNPRQAQLDFLADLKRLVKPDGFLYIGIENRWWPMYFYNIRDPHSKVKYTSILPRWLANILCRLKGQKHGYQNYLYGLAGYRKLLAESGWTLRKVLAAWPSYREVEAVYDLADKQAIEHFYQVIIQQVQPPSLSKLFRLLHWLRLDKFFLHSYLLIATPSAETSLAPCLPASYLLATNDQAPKSLLKVPTPNDSSQAKIIINPGADNASFIYCRRIRQNQDDDIILTKD